MNKQQVIDYILETPNNTNPAILSRMIDEVGGGENINSYPIVYEQTSGRLISIEYYNTDDIITFPDLPTNYDDWTLDFDHYNAGDTFNISDVIAYYPNGICFQASNNGR